MKMASRPGLFSALSLLLFLIFIFFKQNIQSFVLKQAQPVISEFDSGLNAAFDFSKREWTLLPPGVYLTDLTTTDAFQDAFNLQLSSAEAYGQLALNLLPRPALKLTSLTADHPQIKLSLEPSRIAEKRNDALAPRLLSPLTIHEGDLKIEALKSEYSIKRLEGELALNPEGELVLLGTGEWGRSSNLQVDLRLKAEQTDFDLRIAHYGRFQGSSRLSNAGKIVLHGELQPQRIPWASARRALALPLPVSGALTAQLQYSGAPGDSPAADLFWSTGVSGALDFRQGIFLRVNLLRDVLEQMSAVPGLSELLSSALRHPPVQEALKADKTHYDLFRITLNHPGGQDKIELTQCLLVTPLYTLQGEGWVLKSGTFSLSGEFILSDYLSEKLLGEVKSLRYLRNTSNRIVAPVVLRGGENIAEIRVDLGALADKMLYQSRAVLVKKSEEKVAAYFEQEEPS